MSKRRKKDAETPRAAEEAVERGEAVAREANGASEVVEDYKEKYLRALAEMDNVRKRSERDMGQARRFALESLLRSLLPVLDSLQYALEAEGETETIRHGVELALQDALKVLSDHGMERIDALHEPFDPRWHEAVGMQPSEDCEPGTVLHEERRGYRLHDRVLRPARVHIAMAPPQPVPDDAADEPEEEAE